MSQTKTVVVIPIYRNFFDKHELQSLRSVKQQLCTYDIVFVAPKKLNVFFLREIDLGFDYKVEFFEDYFFTSVDTYSHLLMKAEFYKRFISYDYMLICQTDAYVFRNELEEWVQKNYDYIGAPWLDSENKYGYHSIRKLYNNIKKFFGLKYRGYEHINRVGNGGFSLRKIQRFYEICLKEEEQVEVFVNTKEPIAFKVEDMFWSFYIPSKYDFNIPDYQTAAHFCLDRKPNVGMKITQQKLPFACHGFNKKGVHKFWSKYIKPL